MSDIVCHCAVLCAASDPDERQLVGNRIFPVMTWFAPVSAIKTQKSPTGQSRRVAVINLAPNRCVCVCVQSSSVCQTGDLGPVVQHGAK